MKWLLLVFLLPNVLFAAPTKVVFWHSMAGHFSTVLNKMIDQFNQSQSDVIVVPQYKGTYTETLTSTVAAFRAKQHPTLVQVYEVGTASMINPPGIIKPVHQLFEQTRVELPNATFIPAIKSYYSDQQGRLLAFPFNSSTAVLYINRSALKKSHISQDYQPVTWPEVAKLSKRFLEAGYACGFTFAFPSWTQIEMLTAWHNIPLASQDNGFAGLSAEIDLQQGLIIDHFTQLTRWQAQGLLEYGGRDDSAISLFTSGYCPILIHTSGIMVNLNRMAEFGVTVAPLPYWPNVSGAPQNTIIGGAAIWVMERHSPEQYDAAAKFLAFLMQPEIQAFWQENTGYFAVSLQAQQLSREHGFYQQYPGAKVALNSLNRAPPTDHSKGIRLGNYTQIRDIHDDAIEAMLSGQETVRAALRNAQHRANRLLRRFQRNRPASSQESSS